MKPASSLSVAIVVAGFWMIATPARAIADEQKAAGAQGDAAPAGDPATTATSGEAWRYKRHDGLWWYWLPTNRWVYWVDNRWVDYDPAAYAKLRASRAPQTSNYRGGGQSNWGPWGPIRYDRFGTPEYPYSARKRGMKQLGPVPTPAGVRSLPGWGGER